MNDAMDRPTALPWPPLIYGAALLLAIGASIVLPSAWIGRPMSDILLAFGGLLVAATVALYVTALRAFTRARTTVQPNAAATHLITDGPFKLSRNPLYLANTILMIGIGLVTGSLWFLALGIVAAFAVQKLAIEPEERHLQARFGRSYREYAKRVRRWI